jgi:signal transduction histidine kinase
MIDGYIVRRLSAKLLLMTIGFVMLAELVIFVPSAALYRQNWLMERVDQAAILTQALTGVPDYEASEMLSKDFMEKTSVELLAAKRDGMTELILGFPPEGPKFIEVDMRSPARLPLFRDAFSDFFSSGDDRLRVIANSPVKGQEAMELIIPRQALKDELHDFFERILILSLAIAIITGILIYLSMLVIIVRPLQKLLNGMKTFRENPQFRQNIGRSNRRKDEIGELEREFFDTKQSLRAAFRQRERLAGLGLSVAKINHDLRNVLSTALLIADRLTLQKDPKIIDMGEKLVRTVERGVGLTEDVLAYSRAETADPDLQPLRLSFLLGEVAGDTLAQFPQTNFRNDVPTELQVFADPDHVYRILHNLFRNAAQAMAESPEKLITVSVETTDGKAHLCIVDTGPGLPEKTEKNLFLAFAASHGKDGSTGLGLSISKELAVAQGGDLWMVKTDPSGTHFQLILPLPPK